MIGFIVGAACVIGLAKAMRRHHRWHAWHRHGGMRGCSGMHGPGYGPYRGGEPFGGEPFGAGHDEDAGFAGAADEGARGPWAMLAELRLTREQRRALRDLREEWADTTRTARRSARDMKDELAVALRAESFEEGLVGASLAKFDELAESLKQATLSSLAKAHQILDARQRERLAEMLERSGGRRARWAL